MLPFVTLLRRIPCILHIMIWGSCLIVEVLLAMMGAMFIYKAASEEDQSGADAMSEEQVNIPRATS